MCENCAPGNQCQGAGYVIAPGAAKVIAAGAAKVITPGRPK